MLTNCRCKPKVEDWNYDQELGCWYVIRSCESCQYYWEGPDHSKTNHSIPPAKNVLTPTLNEEDIPQNSLSKRVGQFKVFCYDEKLNYGRPIQFDEVADIFNFCELNRYSHHQINVVSKIDELCVQVVQGLYVFPKEWDMFNPQR